MKDLLLVGVGGFIGSIARYKLGGLVLQLAAQQRFPYGTFAVNVLGCLVMGLLAGVAARYEVFGPGTRLLLFTGVLGGFTTFSAFGLEATQLVRRGDFWIAALYAGSSVVLGIAAVWVGIRAVGLLPR
ncbi:fluoride efflux transporter CrcB [Novilysobacter erysipheiresistens]|uniref:Fluoride-specific ion channel FluC n=1 Tax=Novilysobacter erysipheiresistens TaxID=1749332 RepID=A0ABU7YY52_9GAMM